MKITTICAALALSASSAPTVSAQISSTGPYYATPSWDQQLPASSRYVVLTNWGSAAFLDREDGLVWQIAPATPSLESYAHARGTCLFSMAGGRGGWRLPTLPEAQRTFLITPSPDPFGLPFLNPELPLEVPQTFWTSTTFDPAGGPTDTVALNLYTSPAGAVGYAGGTLITAFGLCVQGPTSASVD